MDVQAGNPQSRVAATHNSTRRLPEKTKWEREKNVKFWASSPLAPTLRTRAPGGDSRALVGIFHSPLGFEFAVNRCLELATRLTLQACSLDRAMPLTNTATTSSRLRDGILLRSWHCVWNHMPHSGTRPPCKLRSVQDAGVLDNQRIAVKHKWVCVPTSQCWW